MHSTSVAALLVLLSCSAASDECGSLPITKELVSLLAQHTELMAEVAAQKADFALVFDATQELQELEAAATATQSSTVSPTVAMIFTQLLAGCAKQEQEAHMQAAVDEAEAAGEVVEMGEDGEGGRYGTMQSSYESLEEVQRVVSALRDRVLETWQVVSQPEGEWEQQGCECARAALDDQFATRFQPAAMGGCGVPQFSEMLIWALLSASGTCRI